MEHAWRRPARTALLCLAIVSVDGIWSAGQDHKSWKDYGGGADSSHFVALDQINKPNVRNLEVAWTYPTGDDRSYLFNPIVVDNVMYVLARNSSLVALDAATGKEIWIHENLPGLTTRGIAYWENRDRSERRLIFTMNNYLQEIEALCSDISQDRAQRSRRHVLDRSVAVYALDRCGHDIEGVCGSVYSQLDQAIGVGHGRPTRHDAMLNPVQDQVLPQQP